MRLYGGRPLRDLLFCALFCGLGTLAYADPVVLKGSVYLSTLPGTNLFGIPLQGAPFGPGNTDTIVQRLGDANFTGVGDSDTIDTELVALSLVSTVPVDLGAGPDLHYVTLQSDRGGPATFGHMTINLVSADDHAPNTPEGTVDSFLHVFFDIRKGSTFGPIVTSGDLSLTSSGSWDADPPAGALLVTGPVGDLSANWHTGKSAEQMDFFPGQVDGFFPNGSYHGLLATPEPGTVWLLATGLAAVGLVLRRKQSTR